MRPGRGPFVPFWPYMRRGRELEFKESLQHPPIRRRCMRLPKREEKHRFWELVRAGVSRTEAAVAAGVPSRTAKRWFHQAGGVLPPKVPETSTARYLRGCALTGQCPCGITAP